MSSAEYEVRTMQWPLRVLTAVAARQVRPAKPLPIGTSRSSFLHLTLLEIGNTYGGWFAALTVALALWWVSLVRGEEPVVLWAHWSMYAAQSFAVVGTVIAAWSAWVASGEHRHQVDRTSRQSAVPAWARDLCPLASGAVLGLGAYATVCSVVLGYAATRATWGGPDWPVIAFGAVWMLAYVAVGATIGRLWPRRWVALVVFAGLLLHVVISLDTLGTASPYQAIAYVSSPWDRIDHFYAMNGTVNELRLDGGMGVGTGVIVVMLTCLLHRHRRVLIVGSVLGTMLIIGGWAAATRDAGNFSSGMPDRIEHPEMICSGSVVEVCLHKAYAEVQPAVADEANRLLAPIAGLDSVPQRITQQPVAGRADPAILAGAGTELRHVMFPLADRLFDGSFSRAGGMALDGPQIAIITWLMKQADLDASTIHFVNIDGGPDPWSTAGLGQAPTTAEVADWEAEQARLQTEAEAGADRFASLSPEDQRTWLEANWDALRAGELTLEDLP